MALALFCGDPICKRPVALLLEPAAWPLRCHACGAALYPADVLERLPLDELEPKRNELMTERGGIRVPVRSPDLTGTRSEAAAAAPDVDRILAMVELDPEGAAGRRKRVVWIVAIVVVAALAAAIVAAMR